MYTDTDRARDDAAAKQIGEIHWMLDKRVRPQLDKLEEITNGRGWGIRHLLGERRDEIAELKKSVEEISTLVPTPDRK